MATIELDLEQADALIQRAVNERGADFVYPNKWRANGEPSSACLYQVPGEPGKPACIIGMIANYLGVLDRMPEFEPGVDALEKAGVKVDEEAAFFLQTVQTSQDTRNPWGDALQIGREEVEGYIYANEQSPA
jgi:hypothetical protein